MPKVYKAFKSNCTVIIDKNTNRVIDIVSDYDIAYRDLINNGLCDNSNAITTRAFINYSGRIQAPKFRFTKRENGSDLYCTAIIAKSKL